jgi:glutaredoxin
LKKYIIIGILVLMLLAPICGASTILLNNKEIERPKNTSFDDFTHTVIAEYGSLTTCPYCVTASSQLNSIYNLGDLDFYFVTLVGDEGNANVRKRMNELGISVVPDVYFDGGYKKISGAQSSEKPYGTAINQSGARVVPDIDISVVVDWIGGGILKFKVTVINNEAETYNGQLRVYILEKESRWNDKGGHPYHYAVLDIPIDKSLSIIKAKPKARGDSYTFSKTWFGSFYGFGDITQGNVLVVASVFDPDTGFAVQTSAAEPTVSNSYLTLKSLIFERLFEFFPMLNKILEF